MLGKNNISKILWGLPVWSGELEENINSKKIVLGECCVSDNDPAYHCNDWQT